MNLTFRSKKKSSLFFNEGETQKEVTALLVGVAEKEKPNNKHWSHI